jgi:hypothetical protein
MNLKQHVYTDHPQIVVHFKADLPAVVSVTFTEINSDRFGQLT